jgi:hypothetical protein
MKTNGAGSTGVERRAQIFLEALPAGGGKPIEQLSVPDARAVLVGAQAGVKLDLPKADISEKTINADHHNIKLTIVRPAGVKETLPAFMFFHRVSWVLGDFLTPERLVRDLVAGSGATAVFVIYTPSAEVHHPTKIKDAYAATRWVAERSEEINIDGTRLMVSGNSAGGNIAACRQPEGQRQGHTEHQIPGAVLSDDECELREHVVRAVRRRALPDPEHDDLVLGKLHERPEAAAGRLCLAPPGDDQAAQESAARSHPGSGKGRAARRRRRLRALAECSRRRRHCGSLQRPNSRLRSAQCIEPSAWCALGAAAGVRRVEAAAAVKEDAGKEATFSDAGTIRALGIGAGVNTKNPNRLPLLLIAAEEDRTIVPSLVRATYGTQRRTPSVTTFKSFLGRLHFPMVEPGWEEIAAYAIQWASEHARYVELSSSQNGID